MHNGREMLMQAETSSAPKMFEVFPHGSKVRVHRVFRLDVNRAWRDLGEEFSGIVVGSHSLSPEVTGIYNIIPDYPLPRDDTLEYRDKGPRMVSVEESGWHQLSDTYLVETRFVVVPELENA